MVDDDDIMQEILLRILEEQGAIVNCCSDALLTKHRGLKS